MTYFPATPRPVGKSKRFTLPGRYMRGRLRECSWRYNELRVEPGTGNPEIRNPKPEIRKNARNQSSTLRLRPEGKPKKEKRSAFRALGFGHSFGFRVSGFWFRIYRPLPSWEIAMVYNCTVRPNRYNSLPIW